MAKKNIKTEVKPLPTKRQLSRHRRQQRIQHIIYITGAVFFVLIVSFLGYGYWNMEVKPYHQPAAKINGVTYDMDYYMKFLELYSRGQDATQTANVANNIVNLIEYSAAVQKAAPELGYTVSNDEVAGTLKTLGIPDDKAFRNAVTSTLLANKLLQDYFDKQVPASTEQVDAQALFVESTEIAAQVTSSLSAGENFTAMATGYSLEPITRDNGGNLGWLVKGFTDIMLGNLGTSALKDIPFTLQAGELSQPTFDATISKGLGYWVVQVTEKDPTKGSHARGILAGSKHDGDVIRAKILAGDDFATLVKDYSQDSASADVGGDLGWTGDGIANKVAMGQALTLESGAISQPLVDFSVQTKGGFWLVKVVNRDDNRAIDDTTRQTLRNGLFDNWITEKMKGDSVETLLTEDQKSWAINLVVKARGK